MAKNVERLQAREAKELIRRENDPVEKVLVGGGDDADIDVYDFVAHLHNGRNGIYYIHSVSGEYSYGILRKKYGYGIRRGIIALFRHRFYFLSGNGAYYFLPSPCGQIRA